MANLATDLLRTVARAFYPTEHILLIETLLIHSTLPDTDLAHVLGMQPKALRKLCGRLKEDGIISVQTRAEKRTHGGGGYIPPGSQQSNGQGPREKMTNRDWYYLNYHRAIDSIKYRMYKLNEHFSSLGAPTTEKKDLSCPQCKSQWTELEVMDKIDFDTGLFLCARCWHTLDPVDEEERVTENESVKRLNSQLEKVLTLMQQIDAATVPENDFNSALSKQRPIIRTDVNPGQRTETVDLPTNRNLMSSKGLEIKPEKIAVSLQNDEDVKRANAEAEERARREKEARQNALPDWIAKSTVTGDVTTVGAKEEQQRKEREAHLGVGSLAKWEDEERKPDASADVDMAAYWAELERNQRDEAAKRAAEDAAEEDEEDDDDEDEFEDVGISTNGTSGPATNGESSKANGAPPPASTGISTPALESSNATDDEREAKRPRLMPQVNGKAKGTPAASDADDDEDELEFENV